MPKLYEITLEIETLAAASLLTEMLLHDDHVTFVRVEHSDPPDYIPTEAEHAPVRRAPGLK